MRISDWSSDVCSSDLKCLSLEYCAIRELAEDIVAEQAIVVKRVRFLAQIGARRDKVDVAEILFDRQIGNEEVGPRRLVADRACPAEARQVALGRDRIVAVDTLEEQARGDDRSEERRVGKGGWRRYRS